VPSLRAIAARARRDGILPALAHGARRARRAAGERVVDLRLVSEQARA
jgi:hypothetical protein